MDGYEHIESLLPPPLSGPRGTEPVPVEVEEDRAISSETFWKPVPVLACDGVRQLAVVVWARTKLLERTLANREDTDPRLIASLGRIDSAIAMLSDPLDLLEDMLERQAA